MFELDAVPELFTTTEPETTRDEAEIAAALAWTYPSPDYIEAIDPFCFC